MNASQQHTITLGVSKHGKNDSVMFAVAQCVQNIDCASLAAESPAKHAGLNSD
jgi:hypothetical protein